MMACYDQAKQTITSITNQPDSLATKLGSAAAAGFCCAALSLPFDMIKSKLQNQTIDKITGKPQYRGVIDCGTKILQKEGLFAFWKGFGSYYLRCAPHAMVILLSVEFITMKYRQLFAQSGELTIKSLADSARVIEEAQVPTSNRVGSGMKHGFFALQQRNDELEAELRSYGKWFAPGVRVIAIADSHWGSYKVGSTGVITEMETGKDPIVHWDHSPTGEKPIQTSKLKIQTYEAMALSDGTELKFTAAGKRVVATDDSYWGHYKKGDTGTITKINPTDPVVKWDHSKKEKQTSKNKLSALIVKGRWERVTGLLKGGDKKGKEETKK